MTHAGRGRAFTTRSVLDRTRPIVGVVHELDGDWQFLDGEVVSVDDGVAVHPEHIFDEHPEVAGLVDLPRGWEAWRDAETAAWHRERSSQP